jgi:Ala-tRNA(Pro) deacylase
MPETPLTRRLLDLLEARGVPHRVVHHPPARTSAEAARLRGTALESGAKALVCHADERIVLIVVPGDRRLDGRAFKRQTGVKNVRMVDAVRVEELIGAQVGAVPPFGSLAGLTTYADRSVVAREEITFSAGARDVSVSMGGPDYAALEQPVVGEFAQTGE